jgi:hypothetical protein
MRVHAQTLGAEPAGQGGADPEQHRVAAGQNGRGLGRTGDQLGDERIDRRGPGAPAGAGVLEQRELPLGPDDGLGRSQSLASGLAETGPTIGADADDDNRVRHRASTASAASTSARACARLSFSAAPRAAMRR